MAVLGRALGRVVAVAAMLAMTAIGAVASPCPPGTPPSTVEGAWNGAWRARDARSAGVVLIVGAGGSAIGQFTFLSGAMSRSGRYLGGICGSVVTFSLASGGEITLTLDGARLLGGFRGPDPVLPANEGTIEMTRG